MLIRLHRESPTERRVALAPRAVKALIDAGHQVMVPTGAGAGAGFRDDAYRDAGAEVFTGEPAWADLVAAVGPITAAEIGPAAAIVALLDPLGNPGEIARIAAAGMTALAMEMIPRTTKAQMMDALSSQATAAGYEAVLLAARRMPRFMPMLMTAAGTIPPARVLVIGAGVAGLQAIATARRLGGVVSGYDIRPAAAEQVESLGATFVGGPVEEQAEDSGGYAGEVSADTRARQMEALGEHIARSDMVITTAAVPGRPAPRLITREMVEAMKAGSIIVDVAAATGGNCEVTVPGEEVDVNGVIVLGPLDLPAQTAGDASEMYARNVRALLDHLTIDGELVIDPDDEIAAGTCVARGGEITNARVLEALQGGADNG